MRERIGLIGNETGTLSLQRQEGCDADDYYYILSVITKERSMHIHLSTGELFFLGHCIHDEFEREA
jgi:hypothetical protein